MGTVFAYKLIIFDIGASSNERVPVSLSDAMTSTQHSFVSVFSIFLCAIMQESGVEKSQESN